MPRPGSLEAARFAVTLHDPAWDVFYMPVAKGIEFATGHLNRLQFLTIRRYLTIVFSTLVFLLLVLALWL